MAGFRVGEFNFSGNYYIAVEDSPTPEVFVKFTGFESPVQVDIFIQALEELLSEPLEPLFEDRTLH